MQERRSSPREQFAGLTAYGVAQGVRVGDVVFRPGDLAYDLIVIEVGWIEIVSPPSGSDPRRLWPRTAPAGSWGNWT